MKYYAVRLVVALSTFIIGLTSASLLGPFNYEAAPNGSAEQEVLQVERQYVRANLQRDTAALDDILAYEFTITAYGHRISTKEQRLALLRNPDFIFESLKTDDLQVKVSGDSATVTGAAVLVARNHGEEFTTPVYRFTRAYEKRDGRWQIVSVRVLR